MAHLIVIGGGITGVTSAYALAREGHLVTLIEQHRYAGMETSHANGGQLSASNAETWTHPSTLLKGIKWMLKADAPLLVNPKPSWHKLSLVRRVRGRHPEVPREHHRHREAWPSRRANTCSAGHRPKASIST